MWSKIKALLRGLAARTQQELSAQSRQLSMRSLPPICGAGFFRATLRHLYRDMLWTLFMKPDEKELKAEYQAPARAAGQNGVDQPRLRARSRAGSRRTLLSVDTQGTGQNRFCRAFERTVRADARGHRRLARSPERPQAHGADKPHLDLQKHARPSAAQAFDPKSIRP